MEKHITFGELAIKHIAPKKGLNNEVIATAIRVHNSYCKAKPKSRRLANPVAAACLYLAALYCGGDQRRTQREMCNEFCSEVGLRNCVRDIEKALGSAIYMAFVSKGGLDGKNT